MNKVAVDLSGACGCVVTFTSIVLCFLWLEFMSSEHDVPFFLSCRRVVRGNAGVRADESGVARACAPARRALERLGSEE